jgi:Ca2+-binding RTX toxin-like protein
MATNSPQEQLMLELINRARMYPAAEAARLGIALNQGLAPGTISTAPKQVLAMNDLLVIAADRHSNWMIVNDQFNHVESPSFPSGRSGLNPGDRIAAAGYLGAFTNGENISWTGVLPGPINLSTSIVSQHNSLFLSPGHRVNILGDAYQEVGIGQQHGAFKNGGTNYDSSMITQNFATSGSKVFVTGVVYNDIINDNFFSINEQVVGRGISGTGGVSDVTGGGGGYELSFATNSGAKAITFGLATGAVGVSVTVGTTNIKVDVVNGREVWTNASLAVTTTNVTEIHALGIQSLTLTGSTASENIVGNPAGNTLDGGGGNDILNGGGGADTMFGRLGSDTYVVDNAGDIVNETGGDGSDTVQSTISFSLANAARAIGTVERLTLIGTAGIGGAGTVLDNVLTGNAAGNPLNGLAGNDVIRGGLGIDSLTGGPGADSFCFNTAPSASTSNRDIVFDFAHGVDKFWMENAVYAKLGAATGALNPAFLRVGAAALDGNDYIVYNKATGALFYDSNGSLAGGVMAVAVLANKPVLTASDFLVI